MELRHLKEQAGDLWTKGRFDKAEVLYRQILLQQPREAQLWVRHAEALRRLGRSADAVESYRRASEMLADQGHLARAIASLKLALELKPDDIDLISEIIRLEVRKSQPRLAQRMTPPSSPPTAEDPSRTTTARELRALPMLAEPITTPGVTLEIAAPEAWPKLKRLNDHELGVKASESARWLIISSSARLNVRFADGLEEPDALHEFPDARPTRPVS